MELTRASGSGLAAVFAAALLLGCDRAPDAGVDGDGDGDADATADGGTDGDLDADAVDAAPEADVDLPPGPATFIIDAAELLVERRCDLDGDGDLDNAIADLGSPADSVFAMALNSALAGALADQMREGLHMPWVDDLAGRNDDDLVLIMFEAADADDPEDPADDFDGESFWVDTECLDRCGEPIFVFASARLEGGAITGAGGTVAIPVDGRLVGRNAMFEGALSPGATELDAVYCAYALTAEMGALTDEDDWRGLTLLERFLAGGGPLGLPTIPGLQPDIDLDGDGLETYVIDDEHHITTCVDGDHTTVAGRDCWQDPRFADALSVTMRVHAVPATLLGRPEGWGDRLAEECPEGPPDPSLFDPS